MSLAAKRAGGLGRGLSSLLEDLPRVGAGAANGASEGVHSVPIADIAPHPGQPRRHFDETALDELARSIAEKGILQPILVRPHGNGYQIIAGERRWRAAQRAQMHEVPVVVREVDDAATFELALIENIQREDLNAIEEGEAYRRLIGDFGHTQDALGKLIGKSRSHIANLIRLLDLPAAVREAVAAGTLSMGHARALITADDPEALAADVLERGLSVRETERLAKRAKPPKAERTPQPPAERDSDLVALERQLSDSLGLDVWIDYDGKSGMVRIVYATLEQLDMICERLSADRF